ncbi:amidohydrolase family protein [Variovorax sp. RA8]|uniref:amidohydrolase family protein n=1 Tax=Variovorax sp. (strain JCM 16519 / RA8) TaxID=662548 RepID=UPI001316AA81|nr:amidohydrolase family protein [Variovorax sp. RA8]VTU16565.1 putative metal-dependent hydrolase of the TIM-barrel fold protein [Variovorax sp. RA8]
MDPDLVEPFVDAHQHFWDLDANPYPWLQGETVAAFRYGDYSALRRNYLLEDLARDTRGRAPAATVHVEAEWDRADPVAETRWLTQLAQAYGRPSAVVAHAALDHGDVAGVLAAQAAFPLVRGIRHKPVTAASPAEAKRGLAGSMDDARWRGGYALLATHGLSFDLQAPWWNLDQAAELARDFPHTMLILNHTGLPADRSEAGMRGWRAALEALAAQPNTAIKISGLGRREVPWTQADNVPVMREAIAIFGPSRCMFASNFPVDSLVADYATILAGFEAAIAPRPAAVRRALWHDNAVRYYRLDGA